MDRHSHNRARAERVLMLLGLILVLSAADLFMTVLHLTQVGMFEANPIAVALIAQDSVALLVLWKLATVGVALAILFRLRRVGVGEVGAWIGAAALTLVTVQWIAYADTILDHASVISMIDAEASWRTLSS